MSFDRDRAEDLGVGVGDVAGTMQTLLGGRRVSTFTQNNKLYDVIVQLDPAERATPNDVAGLNVKGRDGQLVQLSAVTTVKEGVGPQRLNHFDRVRSFTLTAGLDPGFTLGEALDSLNRVAAEVLPPLASTRARRRVARAGGERRRTLLRVRPGAAGRVHGARVAVRVDDPSAHGARGGAAGHHRRARDALPDGRHDQPLQPDRHDPADRPGDEELHSAGGVRQPAARSAASARTRRSSRPAASGSARSS